MEKLFGIKKLAVDEKTICHVLPKLMLRLPITFTFQPYQGNLDYPENHVLSLSQFKQNDNRNCNAY